MRKIKLSVIVPVYNEELAIAKTLDTILSFLKRKKYNWEIIVVDDGSLDNTSGIVQEMKTKDIRLEKLTNNQGKGAAIRRGVMTSRGELIIFTDADLSVPIEFMDKIIGKLENGYDVVIGSRRIEGSKIIKHQNFLRENMGRVFTLLSQMVTGTWVSDFTCGFKGFKTYCAKSVFSRSLLNRWVFDSEIIFLARKFKFRIGEVAVEWINREDSRIKSLGSTGYKSFLELMQIRLNDFKGKYD